MSNSNLALLLNLLAVVILSVIQGFTGSDDLVVVGLLSGISYLLLLRRLELGDADD